MSTVAVWNFSGSGALDGRGPGLINAEWRWVNPYARVIINL